MRTGTLIVALLAAALHPQTSAGEVLTRKAKETLTAIEMNHGDQLRFTPRSGRTVCLQLEGTEAAIHERVTPGGIVYRFSCRVRIDGQPMTLSRFVCSQECFYEPYVVAGLRIWPDTVKAVFDLVPVRYPREGNLRCVPRKDARFALQDASLRICPQEIHPWLEEPQDFIEVGRCYNGDDCYLGPYLGQACHVGLDINHSKGSRLLAPIDFDTHAYFNSLEMGHENNRWRGIRRWPGGDVWALQTHHLIELLVPQNTPLAAGTKYATTAGVHVGSHEHTHFEFKIAAGDPGARSSSSGNHASIGWPVDFDDESEVAADSEVLHLDPWIVFWQIFEDRKAKPGGIRAAMKSPASARAGERVIFSAEGSRAEVASEFSCWWTFGDGGFATGHRPAHVFARPGIYPVTLLVDDGTKRATATHHIVVTSEPVREPVLALTAADEPSFRVRPDRVADVYGSPPKVVPHTLRFVARPSRPIPRTRTIALRNLGDGHLPAAQTPRVEYAQGAGWLSLKSSSDPHALAVVANGTGLNPGCYLATVVVDCPGAANSPQSFRVELNVQKQPAESGCTIDDGDDGFYATPYFWVGHRFSRCPKNRRGHEGFYLTNGGGPAAGEFARFTPDLAAGTYGVSLAEATPFGSDTEFDVRVRHRGGETKVRVRPERSRAIGEFEFEEGSDGFVEILAEGAKGLVIADAVVFQARRLAPAAGRSRE